MKRKLFLTLLFLALLVLAAGGWTAQRLRPVAA
jgi:outer membrane lipoprotein-sorting protein